LNLDRLAAGLADGVEGSVERDVSLARFTTYRLGGPAAIVVEPASESDLVTIAALVEETTSEAVSVPILAVGRGSNLVISDEGFPGVVVRMSTGFSWVRKVDGTENDVVSGAATTLPVLANWAARRSLHGLEFTVAIPGSVGGAVRMNAGAHGSEVSARLASARIFSFGAGAVDERDVSALDLSYRHSNLTDAEIVTAARFTLEPRDATQIKEAMDRYRRHRAETQPGALQNAGSVFKNPPGDSSGRLIETAGLKGFRVGGASVSTLHANFFVAEDGATAQDVHDLVGAVRERVKEHHGVDLHPEIRFVGVFRPTEVTA
jgi:UDP-N-acetylmuramate dehydrogenase